MPSAQAPLLMPLLVLALAAAVAARVQHAEHPAEHHLQHARMHHRQQQHQHQQPDTASGTSGCGALAGEKQPTLRLDDAGSSFTFGTSLFAVTIDRTSLALLNVTTCSADGHRQQGFLWPDGVASPAVTRFSLWQMSYSNCTQMMPGGQLDGFNASAGRNFSVAAAPDGGRVLTLRWQGMQSEFTGGTAIDISVAVTMRSGSAQAQLRGSVGVTAGSPICIQSLVLPNFEQLMLRSPAQDKMFTPWFFGQVGDQSKLCGGGDCTLDLAKVGVMDGELELMPNGNERSMQFAALYSTPSPSPAQPLGLYIGAHSPDADLMILLMQGAYCPPPPPPGFSPNRYDINATLQHSVDTGSAGGDLGSVGKMTDWDACARKCGENKDCRSWVWNSNTSFCYPKSRVGVPKSYGPQSAPDIYGCSPSYPAATCVAGPPPGPPTPNRNDCGSFSAVRWNHFPQNSLAPLGPGAEWTLAFDVVIAGFEGDWFDASMIYRTWALREAVWTRAGNLTTRSGDPNYPQWLLEAPFWTTGDSGAQQGDNIRLAAELGTAIGTHWYGWEQETFDTHYPVYTPKAGFKAATAAMQAATPPVYVVRSLVVCLSGSNDFADLCSRFWHRFHTQTEGSLILEMRSIPLTVLRDLLAIGRLGNPTPKVTREAEPGASLRWILALSTGRRPLLRRLGRLSEQATHRVCTSIRLRAIMPSCATTRAPLVAALAGRMGTAPHSRGLSRQRDQARSSSVSRMLKPI